MATVVKNFRIKSGLIVEGTSGTINGHNILTESTSGDQYILNLVGGATLVKSVDTAVFNVDGSGKLTVNANTFDSYGSASAAQTAAESFATTAANNAQSAAEATASADATNKANTAKSEAISAAATDATTKANAAQAAAESTAALDATSKANAAQAAAEATASADATSKANAAQAAAESYADNKINDTSNATDKVWSAYKTSTEIGLAQAAAEQHADEAVAALVGLAPSTLDTIEELATALENNPDIIANLESVAAGKQDALTAGSNIDITGSTISVTGLNAADISDFNSAALSATSAAYDAAGSASAAQSGAETTAQNALSDVLAGSTQFTEVAVDWMVKHVASYAYAANDSETVAYSWNKNKGASAKFLVRVKNGSHSQVSEVLVTRDDADNIAITEYGIVTSNGILGDITAAMNGNNIELKVTPEHVTGSEIFVSGTLMAYTD